MLKKAKNKKAAKRTTKTKTKTPATKKPATKTPATKKPAKKLPAKDKGTLTKKDEFRLNKTNGHPAYIYAKVGGKYKYIGITHSPITNKVKNIKLDTNPNPKDNKTAYVRPSAKQAKVKKFKNNTLKDWKMSNSDKQKIKPLTKK